MSRLSACAFSAGSSATGGTYRFYNASGVLSGQGTWSLVIGNPSVFSWSDASGIRRGVGRWYEVRYRWVFEASSGYNNIDGGESDLDMYVGT